MQLTWAITVIKLDLSENATNLLKKQTFQAFFKYFDLKLKKIFKGHL